MSSDNTVGNILATDLAAAFLHNMNEFISNPDIENRTDKELGYLIQDIFTQRTWITCLVDESNYSWHPWFNHEATLLYSPIFQKLHKLLPNPQMLEDCLFGAAIKGNIDNLEIFYHLGVNLNARDGWKNTALIHAALKGHLNVVQYLVEHDADVNARNILGGTALLMAASSGYANIVQYLVEHNADVNARRDEGGTALTYAAEYGYLHVVQYLVEHNADINIRNNNGRTALMLADERGHIDVAQYLRNLENKK